jgi:hypothetical protein
MMAANEEKRKDVKRLHAQLGIPYTGRDGRTFIPKLKPKALRSDNPEFGGISGGSGGMPGGFGGMPGKPDMISRLERDDGPGPGRGGSGGTRGSGFGRGSGFPGTMPGGGHLAEGFANSRERTGFGGRSEFVTPDPQDLFNNGQRSSRKPREQTGFGGRSEFVTPDPQDLFENGQRQRTARPSLRPDMRERTGFGGRSEFATPDPQELFDKGRQGSRNQDRKSSHPLGGQGSKEQTGFGGRSEFPTPDPQSLFDRGKTQQSAAPRAQTIRSFSSPVFSAPRSKEQTGFGGRSEFPTPDPQSLFDRGRSQQTAIPQARSGPFVPAPVTSVRPSATVMQPSSSFNHAPGSFVPSPSFSVRPSVSFSPPSIHVIPPSVPSVPQSVRAFPPSATFLHPAAAPRAPLFTSRRTSSLQATPRNAQTRTNTNKAFNNAGPQGDPLAGWGNVNLAAPKTPIQGQSANFSQTASQSRGTATIRNTHSTLPKDHPFLDTRFPPDRIATKESQRLELNAEAAANYNTEYFFYFLIRGNRDPSMQKLGEETMQKVEAAMQEKGITDKEGAMQAFLHAKNTAGAFKLLSDGARGTIYYLREGEEHVVGAALNMGAMQQKKWTLLGVGDKPQGYFLLQEPA